MSSLPIVSPNACPYHKVGLKRHYGFVMKTEDRLHLYQRMLSEDPTSRVFVNLAELLYAQGEWKEVVEICRKGLRIHPDSIRGKTLLGLALRELGKDDEAEQVLAGVYEELVKNALALKVLARIYQEKGEWDRASQVLDVYGSLNPVDAEAALARRESFKDERKASSNKTPKNLLPVLELWLEELERSVVIQSTGRIFLEKDRLLLKKLLSFSLEKLSKTG